MSSSSALTRFIAISTIAPALVACEYGVGPGRWDNPFDPEGTNYHPPTVGIQDTAIHDGESGILHARASSTVSTIARIEWTLDGNILPTDDSAISTGEWSPGMHAVIARATDARGLAGPAKRVDVWIGNKPPSLEPVDEVRIPSNQTFVRQLSATDPDGTIGSILWDTIPDRFSIESNGIELVPLTSGGWRIVHWKAIDNEGAQSVASFRVGFVPPPKIAVQPDISSVGVFSATGFNNSWDLRVAEGTKVDLMVSVEIEGFPDETLRVESGGKSCEPEYNDHSVWFPSTNYSRYFRCTSGSFGATVSDRFGRSASAATTVRIMNY